MKRCREQKFDLFESFLKHHNIEKEFSGNIIKQKNIKLVNHTYYKREPYEWVMLSFSWKKTHQGFVYWLNVRRAWHFLLAYGKYIPLSVN